MTSAEPLKIRTAINGRVKIIDNHGDPLRMEILGENGEPISGVCRVRYDASLDCLPTLTLTLESFFVATEILAGNAEFEVDVESTMEAIRHLLSDKLQPGPVLASDPNASNPGTP
jgi:hypothetical protein